MDAKLEKYRSAIIRILTEYADLYKRSDQPGVETLTVFDKENDHYILHTVGWAERKHVWNTILYIRLRDNKIWIEVDWTEEGVATELLAVGIPKDDIVLAFHHPSMRPHTEFAVA